MPVLEQDLQLIRWLLGDTEEEVVFLTQLKRGEQIQVIEGSLLGLEGKISNINTRKGRAVCIFLVMKGRLS